MLNLLNALYNGKNAQEDYDCANGAWMRLVDDAQMSDFCEVVRSAKELGFSQFAENTIENNVFVTLRNDDVQLHIYYCPNERKLRMVADPFSAPYETEKPNVQNLCPTTLWMFENDHSYIDCGMCFLIQCADYSFFVIDSGHFLQPNDHARIYRFMRERTPATQKVVIGGWFITHGHDDHVCQFIKFIQAKHHDVVIEKLYFNYVRDDCRDSRFWSESNKKIMRSFLHTALESGIPIVKLHAGQRFYVRDLCIDVLCTHEDVYPDSLENYNDSSTVLMISVANCKICIPGDAGAVESQILTTRFTADTLSCDVMQVAHHGHFGCSAEFYRTACAKIVLFPNTQIIFDEDWNRYEANQVACALADEYYISSNGTVEVPLPYSSETVKVLPDETFENFDRIHALWGYNYTDERKQQLFDEFLKRSGLPPMCEIEP